MKLHFYENPEGTGYLGWIEGLDKVVAFVRLDGTLQFDW